MSSEHVVVPTEPCLRLEAFPEERPTYFCEAAANCIGCLGDGSRALLAQAVPVEKRFGVVAVWDAMGHRRRDCWVES